MKLDSRGPGYPGGSDLRRLRIWRFFSSGAVQDAFAGVAIAIAAVPFLGLQPASLWLAFILATAALEAPTRRAGHERTGLADIAILIRSLAGAGMGLALISVPDPNAAVAGLSVWGAMVVRATVVDYRRPRQLWYQVGPPVAVGTFRQIGVAIEHFRAGEPQLAAADLSLLILLLAVFTVVFMTLTERRRTFDRILWEGMTKTRQLEDAQRVAELAEHLVGSGHFRIDQRTLAVSRSTGL
ncbi:MAG: hypothetical protein IM641_12335, partial [Phenylobacterium sp.]|nr:hypothetical protein [Phenylobacterium sp.]